MEKIILKGAKNVRDFSNTPTRDNRKVKPHLFLRGGDLSSLTKEDITILKAQYGLKTIIDLRTEAEIFENSDAQMSGVNRLHIPIFKQSTMGITLQAKQDISSVLEKIPDMEQLYAMMVTDKRCIAALSEVFRNILNSSQGALIWHCTEGKDRCGVVSALFLSMIGAGWNDIVSDYMMTNESSLKRANSYYAKVLLSTQDVKKAQKIKDLFLAKEEYISAAFEAIRHENNSLEAFFAKKLGISKKSIDEFKERCLY